MAWSDTKDGWSQRDQRRSATLTDQHGRKYFAVLENKTGDPIVWQPKFESPLATPHTYFEPHPDPERPLDRVINYDRWISDIRAAEAEWQKAGRTAARHTPGLGINPDGSFAPAIMDLIGPRPQRVEPVLAARQGNRWVLGFTKTPDPRLEEFFRDELAYEPDYGDEPDYSDDGDDGEPFAELADLDDIEDPAAIGGKRVRPGKPMPGKAPKARTGRPTQQALGVRRSSGGGEAQAIEAGAIGPKRSHKKRVAAPLEPAAAAAAE